MSVVQQVQNQKPIKPKPFNWARYAVALLIALPVMAYFASVPYRKALALRNGNDALQKEVMSLREEARQYKREISALDSVQGRILLGRRTGLVAENEARLNIPDK